MTTPLTEAIARARLSHHVDMFETASANHENYLACRMVADKIVAEAPEWTSWPLWRAVLFGLLHPRKFSRTVGRMSAMSEILTALKNCEHRAMIHAGGE